MSGRPGPGTAAGVGIPLGQERRTALTVPHGRPYARTRHDGGAARGDHRAGGERGAGGGGRGEGDGRGERAGVEDGDLEEEQQQQGDGTQVDTVTDHHAPLSLLRLSLPRHLCPVICSPAALARAVVHDSHTCSHPSRTERSFPHTTSRYVEVYAGVQVVSVR